MIVIDNMNSINCRTIIEKSNPANLYILQGKAVRLVENIFRMNPDGGGVPLMPDPGDVKDTEQQATIEARCVDQSCARIETRQLEARLGTSLDHQLREQQRAKLEELKKELQAVLGCIEGPIPDPNPTHDGYYIKMCNENIEIPPEHIQKLQSIFRSRGFKLNMKTSDTVPNGTHRQGEGQ